MQRRAFLALPWSIAIGSAVHARAQHAAGILRGRVVDDRGAPLVACRVSIGSLLGAGTEARLLALPVSTRTRQDGTFQIEQVPPGDWYLRVEQDVLPPRALTSDTPDYPVTYYPGVTRAHDAKPIHMTAGGLVAGVTVVVRSIPVFDLVLALGPREALQSATLELFIDATEAGRPRAITPNAPEPDGSVRFRRLRPGPYFVWARATRPGERARAAWRRVEIVDKSERLDFLLAPTARLSGRIVGADAAVVTGARVVAALVDDDGREVDYRNPDSAAIDADRRFTIDGVFGRRALRVIGLPPPWRVQSIRLGARPMGGTLLVPEGGTIADIEIEVIRQAPSPGTR